MIGIDRSRGSTELAEAEWPVNFFVVYSASIPFSAHAYRSVFYR